MLLIDSNVIAAVFDPGHARFNDYRPIYDFLYRHRGVVVSGGTKYTTELGRVASALKALKELRSAGQVRVYPSADVDAEERRIAALAPPPACDDQHIIALVCVSRARVVASDDKRADEYIKRKDLYPAGVKRPSIYRRSGHSRLLDPLPKATKK